MLKFYSLTAVLLCGFAVTDSLKQISIGKIKGGRRGGGRYWKYVTNVSEGKLTGQSSTDYGGVSSRAVDGIWNPNYFYESCMCTKKERHPYWWVDLGSRHYVSTVAIQNRADCCASRLSHIKVMVGDSLKRMKTCANQAGVGIAGEVLMLHCRYGTKGRYVKVQIMKTEYLTMCEVAVFGIPY